MDMEVDSQTDAVWKVVVPANPPGDSDSFVHPRDLKCPASNMDILVSLEDKNADHVVDIILSHLDQDAVRQMELVSERWLNMIIQRKMWHMFYVEKATGDHIWRQHLEFNSNLKKYLSRTRTDVSLVEIHLKYRRLYHDIERDLISVNNSWRAFAKVEFPEPTHIIPTEDSILAINLTNHKIIAGLSNGMIQIFNRQSCEHEQTLRGHQRAVTCLQSRGNTLISGSEDTTIRIWKVNSGNTVNILTQHKRSVLQLKLEDNFLFSCSTDHSLAIWTFQSAVDVRVLCVHRQWAVINCLDFNNGFIYNGCEDGVIRVWRFSGTPPLTLTQPLRGHTSPVKALHCHGVILVSGCNRGSVILWDVRSSRCLRYFCAHSKSVADVRICYGRVITTGNDGKLHFWLLDQLIRNGPLCFRKERRIFNPMITCLYADYFMLAGGSFGTSIFLWNFNRQRNFTQNIQEMN